MATKFQSLLSKINPSSRKPSAPSSANGFSKAPSSSHLFTPTNALIDGEDCLHDCDTCTIRLPAKFSIDEEDKLYGEVKGWSTHMIVATGKNDWVKDVADEKGSVMEAVGKHGVELTNGKVMLSASDIPLPDASANENAMGYERPTRVILLPAFMVVDGVMPETTAALLEQYVARLPTNTTPLLHRTPQMDITATSPESLPISPPPILPPGLTARALPHTHIILLCSQRTRDARCGQSAPLLRREFERHLRPLGLYRDAHDQRPGGVGVYFISHVGGHKYSANCMIYRREGALGAEVRRQANETNDEMGNNTNGETPHHSDNDTAVTNGREEDSNGETGLGSEAAQCIWIARVRPEHCENIVRYTVLQGKVVKPEKQLRGGFDRTKGLVSW